MIIKQKKMFLVFLLLILLVTSNMIALCDIDDSRPIRMAVSGQPNVDPHTGFGAAITQFFSNLYDSLVRVDFKGNNVPLLAESWEISDDDLSYTFILKKGVKFHDGSELKASDVIFSLNRLLKMETGYSYIFVNRIAKVEAIDDYTVRFDLVKPFGPFIDSLCRLYIVNEKLVMANLNMNHATYNYGDEYGDYGRDLFFTNDAGSGPFTLRELVPGNYFIADQFKDYHIPFSKNAPTSIKFINNTEPMTIRTMLFQKELEASSPWQSTESISAMSKIDGVTIGHYSMSSTQHISFNCSLPPTDCEFFRKALASIIDYDLILNTIYPGSKLAIGPCNASTPGAGTQHDTNPYKYDIEKAKEYIALSKYANDLDKYPAEYFSNTSTPAQEKIGLLLQSAAKKIGVTISITSAPYITQASRVAGMETTPNIMCSAQPPWYYDASSSFLAIYTSDNTGTVANPFWILDDTLDQMVYDALEIVDNKERYAAYAKIEAYILDKCFGAYLIDTTEKVAYQSKYVNWPAADYFVNTGELAYSTCGSHYWLHDWSVFPENK